jgi:hypothetical protein
MSIVVPTAPPLANVPQVALMHAGQWDAFSGTHEFTTGDLASAVAAMDCPAVRRPILKFGHDGNHGKGEPALGWCDNLALTDSGRTLVADYVGMPGWLATVDENGHSVLTSAYPDRSIEGEWDYRCQIGHTHPFVVHAVALLGVERPGIGTLPSLQDLAATYGVALSNPPATGTPVTLTVRSDATQAAPGPGGRSTMPNPSPMKVSATVTSEDVRRAYYEHAPWSVWITEMQLDPTLQLITTDDNDGSYSRVVVNINGEEVTFADPVPVQVVYVDKTTTGNTAQAAAQVAMASAAATGRRLVFASRSESRPGEKPAAAGDPVPTPVATPTDLPEPAPADPVVPAAEPEPNTDPTEDDVSDLSDIARGLGLPDDAGKDAILAAINTGKTAEPTPTTEPAPTVPEEPAEPDPATEPVSASTSNDAYATELKRLSTELAAIKAREVAQVKASVLDSAQQAGKFKPAERPQWEQRYDAAPAVITDVLASIAPGAAVPVAAAGYTGSTEPDNTDAEFEALMARLDGPSTTTKGA